MEIERVVLGPRSCLGRGGRWGCFGGILGRGGGWMVEFGWLSLGRVDWKGLCLF